MQTATSAGAGRRLRLRGAVAAAALLALCASPTAGSQTASGVDAELSVYPSDPFRESTQVLLTSSEAVAKASLFIPQGFALDLTHPEGTDVGVIAMFVTDPLGGSPDFAAGTLSVGDPVAYASDAAAQACAPGVHTAVWRSALEAPGRTLDLTVFLDLAGPSAPTGTAFVLTLCPVWPSSSVGVAHAIAPAFDLHIDGALVAPAAPGRYTWSALITPAGPGSLGAEPSRTFEVRSSLTLPRTLTLRAKHDARSKSVLLTGRLLSLGEPEEGVEINFTESAPSGRGFPDLFGPARTNAAGEFSIRRRIRRTTEYSAYVPTEPGSCTAPSSAPGGCVSEKVTPPSPAGAAVGFRKRTDPKLDVRRADRALARSANLKASDFPPGWTAIPLLTPLELCPSFNPNLSALTATGEARSPIFLTQTSEAASNSTVYSSTVQARTAFEKTAAQRLVECLAAEARKVEGSSVLSTGRLSFPRLAEQTRAFRLVLADDRGATYIDLVSFRRGRTVVHLLFAALGGPLGDAHSLAAKVAARMRSG